MTIHSNLLEPLIQSHYYIPFTLDFLEPFERTFLAFALHRMLPSFKQLLVVNSKQTLNVCKCVRVQYESILFCSINMIFFLLFFVAQENEGLMAWWRTVEGECLHVTPQYPLNNKLMIIVDVPLGDHRKLEERKNRSRMNISGPAI